MSIQQAPEHPRPAPLPPTDQETSTGSATAARIVLIALPLLVSIVVLITRPEVFTAVVGSPQAIAIVVGIIAAVLGWSAVLRKFLTNEWLITGLVLAPLAVVGYLFIAPYYAEDVVVDEALPGFETSAQADADVLDEPAPDAAAPADEDAPADELVEASATTVPAEEAPAEPAPGEEAAAGQAPVEQPDADAAPLEEAPVEEAPAPTGPIQLSNGSFVGLDNHFAEGAAALYQLEDGSSIVRLEDVNLQQVPEAVVYLVPGADQTGLAAGNIDLGPLTGNVGSSNYAIPADVDLSAGEYTVLVWCEVFASPVGGASQVAAG